LAVLSDQNQGHSPTGHSSTCPTHHHKSKIPTKGSPLLWKKHAFWGGKKGVYFALQQNYPPPPNHILSKAFHFLIMDGILGESLVVIKNCNHEEKKHHSQSS